MHNAHHLTEHFGGQTFAPAIARTFARLRMLLSHVCECRPIVSTKQPRWRHGAAAGGKPLIHASDADVLAHGGSRFFPRRCVKSPMFWKVSTQNSLVAGVPDATTGRLDGSVGS